MKLLRSSALLFAALCVSGAQAFAQMGPPTSISASQFAASSAGQRVTIVVRVISMQRTSMRGQLLDPESGSKYKATAQKADLFFASGTPIVMGSAQDVKPGAVIAVEGVVTGSHRADVKRVVILTNYVKVE